MLEQWIVLIDQDLMGQGQGARITGCRGADPVSFYSHF
jgi:hypothetical protein